MTLIAALWNRDGEPAGPACAAMLEAQSPAGWPVRIWSDGGIALGIAARDAGAASSVEPGLSGDFVLAADLRLDNHRELAERLGPAGREAERAGDSRLASLCLERWGEEAVDLFVGEFALAWWDRRRERLLLARDFAGQRPLHFHDGRRGVAVSSMAKGLHGLDFVPRAVDRTRMLETLAGLHHEGERTFFEAVRRVEPGATAAFTRGGRVSRRYWSAPEGTIRLKSHGDYAEALRERLDGAVSAQLEDSGPAVAVHLSAGLDSSAVATSLAHRFGGRILAFTAVPPHGRSALPSGRFGDEGPLAALTAGLHPAMEHRLVETPGRLPLGDLDWALPLFERPDLNLPNLAWAGRINDKAAAEGLRILFVGTGGNLGLSYAGFERLGELLGEGRLLAFAREAAAARRNGIGSRALLGTAAHRLLPRFAVAALGPLRDRRGHPAVAGMLNPAAPGVAEALARHGGGDDVDSTRSAQWRARMIRRVDPGTYNKGVALRWNIELRDPTMDRRLVEYCLQVPLSHFFRNGMPRALVRSMLAGRVPDAVRLETRRGLQSPHWLDMIREARGEAGARLDRIESVPLARELLDLPRMRRLLAEWPGQGPPPPVYRTGLIRGLAAGEFLRLHAPD